jgi:hypothetical protein
MAKQQDVKRPPRSNRRVGGAPLRKVRPRLVPGHDWWAARLPRFELDPREGPEHREAPPARTSRASTTSARQGAQRG